MQSPRKPSVPTASFCRRRHGVREKVGRAELDQLLWWGQGMGIHVLGGDESNPSLEEEGLRMLAAVGQGARTPPRLVVLEHRGAAEEVGTVALVGKGVTFDTGGLNLKPTGFIEVRDRCSSPLLLPLSRRLVPRLELSDLCLQDMHMDMGGAAAVSGTNPLPLSVS